MKITSIDRILSHLNLPQYEAVRLELRASALAMRRNQLARTKEQLAAWKPVPNTTIDHTFPQHLISRLWTNEEKLVVSIRDTNYASYQLALKEVAPRLTLNVAAIESDADAQWEASKLFYAARVGEKINTLLGDDATVVCSLALNSALVGTVTAAIPGGKGLTLETSLKTNYRYGEHSANGDMTIYRQVPTLVVCAVGFDVRAKQAELDAAAAAVKDDRKARISICQARVALTQRRRDLWDSLYSTLRYSGNFGTGLPINGNLESARSDMIELGYEDDAPLVSLVSARLALREARNLLKQAKLDLAAAKGAKS